MTALSKSFHESVFQAVDDTTVPCKSLLCNFGAPVKERLESPRWVFAKIRVESSPGASKNWVVSFTKKQGTNLVNTISHPSSAFEDEIPVEEHVPMVVDLVDGNSDCFNVFGLQQVSFFLGQILPRSVCPASHVSDVVACVGCPIAHGGFGPKSMMVQKRWVVETA